MPFLQPLVRQPLYQQVARAIENAIANGEWALDQPIPSETQLAKDFAVSVGTVRRAIAELIDQELLVAYQGSGTYVKRYSDGTYWNRYQRFLSLDGHIMKWQATLVTFERIPASNEVADALGLTPRADVIHVVRRMSAQNEHDEGKLYRGLDETFLHPDYFKALTPESYRLYQGLSLYELYEKATGVIIANVRDYLVTFVATVEDEEKRNLRAGGPAIKLVRRASTLGNKMVEYRIQYVEASCIRVVFS